MEILFSGFAIDAVSYQTGILSTHPLLSWETGIHIVGNLTSSRNGTLIRTSRIGSRRLGQREITLPRTGKVIWDVVVTMTDLLRYP
jgi:hypothetical protein